MSQDRELFGHFCGLDNLHVLSGSDTIMEDYGKGLIIVLIHRHHRMALSDVL